jgi:DNA-directed RNA polymerase specialized sigma24 family protein
LIRASYEESQLERQDEKGYCFELFRRAFEGKDEAAWEAVQHQCYPLVTGWVRLTSCHALTEHEVEDLSQEAFTRFWRTLNKRGGLWREQFVHIGGVLKYLKQCTLTAVLDFYRRQQREARLQERLDMDEERPLLYPSDCLEHVIYHEQLSQVREWVRIHITDFCERLVIGLSFERNFSPLEIVVYCPQHFATVQDVYRVKERVLKRAKRSLNSGIGCR